jgi:hypothetical protein
MAERTSPCTHLMQNFNTTLVSIHVNNVKEGMGGFYDEISD